jgi:hypothetical protein
MATVTTLPGTLNFPVYIGATFGLTLTWTADGVAVDLTGYTAAALTIKDGQDTVVALTLGDGITLGGTAGTITLSIDAEDTAEFAPATADYDLLLTSGSGVVTPLVAGIVTIRKGTTV